MSSGRPIIGTLAYSDSAGIDPCTNTAEIKKAIEERDAKIQETTETLYNNAISLWAEVYSISEDHINATSDFQKLDDAKNHFDIYLIKKLISKLNEQKSKIQDKIHTDDLINEEDREDIEEIITQSSTIPYDQTRCYMASNRFRLAEENATVNSSSSGQLTASELEQLQLLQAIEASKTENYAHSSLVISASVSSASSFPPPPRPINHHRNEEEELSLAIEQSKADALRYEQEQADIARALIASQDSEKRRQHDNMVIIRDLEFKLEYGIGLSKEESAELEAALKRKQAETKEFTPAVYAPVSSLSSPSELKKNIRVDDSSSETSIKPLPPRIDFDREAPLAQQISDMYRATRANGDKSSKSSYLSYQSPRENAYIRDNSLIYNIRVFDSMLGLQDTSQSLKETGKSYLVSQPFRK